MVRHTFSPVPERPSFPKEEEAVLKYWKEHRCFETCVEESTEQCFGNLFSSQ